MKDIFICKKHNTRKKWIGGEPAREENLYCPKCDKESVSFIQRIKMRLGIWK